MYQTLWYTLLILTALDLVLNHNAKEIEALDQIVALTAFWILTYTFTIYLFHANFPFVGFLWKLSYILNQKQLFPTFKETSHHLTTKDLGHFPHQSAYRKIT